MIDGENRPDQSLWLRTGEDISSRRRCRDCTFGASRSRTPGARGNPRVQGRSLRHAISVILPPVTCPPPGDPRAGNRSDSPYPRCNRDRERNSYRSWLERIRKERPPFLTIVSLELPDSPIPLIESQASARSSRTVESKDDVLDEPSDETATEAESDGKRKRSWRKPRRRRGKELLECTKGAPTLEECTKNIVEGPCLGARLSSLDLQDVTGCICAEISGNVRVDIGSAEAEAGRESRSSSPEMAHHTIRIAMRQHCEDRASSWIDDDDDDDDDGEETEGNGRSRPETTSRRNARPRKEIAKEEDGVNDALDFTLNCSGVRLTCRDASLRTGTPR
ncbi:hypothetical protein K0M31_003397 [Melipona bicolor]|uniref:Uncharacterized protein n=1 Tax=Melipona bicolor TaxID=60889 RepID=A0AA40FYX7_9HYME|nr:hypothetical protein K0M31_003397 [Melipona bicolor]